jgi:hypothetical protein
MIKQPPQNRMIKARDVVNRAAPLSIRNSVAVAPQPKPSTANPKSKIS